MIPIGASIICPKRHAIGTVSQQINDDQPVLPRSITFESGQEVPAGAAKVCQTCGKHWCLEKSIYTPDGWVPSDPYLERVPPRALR